jgi:hypothetical protein
MCFEPDARGLRCSVYRWAHVDCSLQGITFQYDDITLFGEGVTGQYDFDEAMRNGHGILKLGQNGRGPIALPLDSPQIWVGHYMFGGNFIYTSDSRFPHHFPIPVFDRAVAKERG